MHTLERYAAHAGVDLIREVVGANPVLWVRCAHLSGCFDDYWDHRLTLAA